MISGKRLAFGVGLNKGDFLVELVVSNDYTKLTT